MLLCRYGWAVAFTGKAFTKPKPFVCFIKHHWNLFGVMLKKKKEAGQHQTKLPELRTICLVERKSSLLCQTFLA